ncbi:isocitrate lyase/phosphoenolpyruvate mutase family protein [Nonomuraea sp. SMC257]|uniref:Isocitrate lyase/phosphoenolpyruvate mutase family protein n=1 Tax=Nonomuraea montanisoli TaxID=2741721 RepID=A0A7Y6I7G3_9ACTN|nr:isocitrate lyase/phosphoenolpyruvate mutase family protein [Nonomuraea montanisoli]NUW33118.1 isocitrate lyase/phosphoenolpyruvate mutase family protein [Nonomuraea montanisoli]
MTGHDTPEEHVDRDRQARLAAEFARLHRRGDPLLLPNAWDVASAALIARAGARAVATTSAGVAWSLGVPDAADLGAARAAAVVRGIAGAVSVPVSADVEAGYGPGPEDVATTVAAAVRAGAVGVNLEDRSGRADVPLFAPAEQAGRLAAARAAADRVGVRAWINARTDVFLTGAAPREGVPEALRRAAVYAEAGADSLFVPGLTDLAAIAELAAGPLPVTVMVWAGAPAVAELAAAGAVRVSLGAAIAQAAYALAARAAAEMLTAGTYDTTAEDAEARGLNDLLAARPDRAQVRP